MSIGWDAEAQRPLCVITVTYDDGTLRLQSVQGVNRSTAETFTFSLLNEAQPSRNQILSLAPGATTSFSIPSNRQPTINPDTGEVDGYSLQLTGAPYKMRR
jgi:hypothetical protein